MDPTLDQLSQVQLAMADEPPPPSGGEKKPFHLQGRPLASTGPSFNILKGVAERATQQGIKQQIDAARPKTFEDLVKQRTKGMSRQDLLESDFMWAKARDLHYHRTVRQAFEPPASQAVRDMANYMLQLNGHAPMTDEELSKMMLDWFTTFQNTPFGTPP